MNGPTVTLLIVLFLTPASAHAQQPGPNGAISERVERLETSLQVVRDYNDDFLSVVLWSLTAVFGLAALLLGASWFQSNRILRREVEALRAELHGLVEARISEIEGPLRERISQSIDEQAKAIESAASVAAKIALSPLERSVHGLRRRLAELEYEAQETEVEKWVQKKVLSNAMRAATKLVAVGVSLGHEFYVDRALDRVDSILNDLQATSRKLEAQDANETERVLEGLGDLHKTARNAILEKLRRLQLL